MFDTAKMLTISTGHLTLGTRRLLDDNPKLWLRTFWVCDYGYITHTESIPYDSIRDDIIECLAFAQENGFDWIRWDVDGDKVDSLPYYDD